MATGFDGDYYSFKHWLKDNGYKSYRVAFDIRVSRGEDPDVIFDEYNALEDQYRDYCEENDLYSYTDWE